MDTVFIHGPMVKFIQEAGKTENKMEKVYLPRSKEKSNMASGIAETDKNGSNLKIVQINLSLKFLTNPIRNSIMNVLMKQHEI